MKIVQKGQFHGDIVETVLENRGVFNKDLYLNPDNSTDSDPFKFLKADVGIELLLNHLRKNNLVRILVDQDADGYMSASLMFQYLRFLQGDKCENIGYILHDSKAHGLTEKVMEDIYESKCNLMIVPDAGSNDISQIEELEANGINVLVIDHHQVTSFTDKGLIVNNQLCTETNHRLVGVGVVYKFLQQLDINYGFDKIDNYLDLVAVGQIGDASDIANNEIRNLVLKGLDNIKNPFLKVAIGQKNGLGIKLAPKDLSFGIIPLINAVTRVGTIEDRSYLFRALSNLDTDKVFPVKKRKKNKETNKFETITFNFNIYEYAYELCSKAKSRQDTAVKKMVAQIDDTLVDDAGVIIAYTGDTDNPGITGLIANKIMSKYDKPVLLLNEQDETFTGSGRGHEKTIEDFRSWCEKSGLVEFARGHDNAFGICIKKDKLNEFKEYSRKIKKQEVIYEVDLISDKPNKDYVEQVENNKRLFGGMVSEPFIGIVGLTVPKKFISLRGSVLTIYSWGVSCVKFGTNPELFEELMDYPEDNVRVNMVGFYGVNNWNGRTSPQLIIKDMEIANNNTNEEITIDNIIF